MPDLVTIVALIASLAVLAGYLRLIVDDKGNVPLLEYRLTGCLGALIVGIMTGVSDLSARRRSREATSTLLLLVGVGLFALVFSGAFAPDAVGR